MTGAILLRILAGAGALVVAFFALKALYEEWPKSALEDQVTKIMMALLTLGCAIVFTVAIGMAGRI
ncbi:MAG: hypothetical protein JO219_02405 [Candidatus Eremiobacteraeota bacterium]|nr:hypothetical protein [Candidatus Eremiobacteraeota bacterium]MBV8365860.1 hypothetical protein [Candidatus Eremiobacteraeota bacterium]